MKTFLLAIIIAMCGLALASCHKNNNDPYVMAGHAGDTAVSVTGASLVYADTGKGILEVYGEKYTATDTTGFVILVHNFTGPATYSLADTFYTPNVVQYVHKTAATSSILTSAFGTLTITAISPNMTGTFSYTTADSTPVTGGYFTAKF